MSTTRMTERLPALTDEALRNRYQILETDSGLQISESRVMLFDVRQISTKRNGRKQCKRFSATITVKDKPKTSLRLFAGKAVPKNKCARWRCQPSTANGGNCAVVAVCCLHCACLTLALTSQADRAALSVALGRMAWVVFSASGR